MKTQLKLSLRLLKKHLTRFITVIAIVAVSVGFTSGIGEVDGKITSALKKSYVTNSISDFYIKSKAPMGFSDEQIQYLQNRYGSQNLQLSFCYETELSGTVTRICMRNLSATAIDKLTLLSGRLPSQSNEILAERGTSQLKDFDIGDTVQIGETEYTVCGTVQNPLIYHKKGELSCIYEDMELGALLYMSDNVIPIVNDIYVKISEYRGLGPFTAKYEKAIKTEKTAVLSDLGQNSVSVLTIYENFGLASLDAYAEKVGIIGILFVVFFLAVTLLVVYSTMSRLLTEERPQIACMKTLGYSNFKIVSKYTFFVGGATAIGGAIAFPIGLCLTWILYSAFAIQYDMPPFPANDSYFYFMASIALIFAATVLLTFFTSLKTVSAPPCRLLTKKAPRSGKKVLLERIGFIWNRLSFKHKSTMRNVFLFRSRFLMTVISILGSTVLIFAGLGLKDTAIKVDNGDAVFSVSIALTVFSAMLCALVVYNLTNINISERSREIATLMVLGYRDDEVCGYIFREVYVLSFIGALLGLPCGYVFLDFAFDYIDFGSVDDITVLSYILAFVITMLFAFISTLMLRKKITTTDMNACLKSLE